MIISLSLFFTQYKGVFIFWIIIEDHSWHQKPHTMIMLNRPFVYS